MRSEGLGTRTQLAATRERVLIGVGSRMVLAAQVVHLPNRSWLAVEFAISTHLNGRVRAL